jgi:hypothetical protein
MNRTHAVIVAESLAKQQWPGQDPLGKRLKIGGGAVKRGR